MATEESKKALKRFHRRSALHDYKAQARKVWTIEEITQVSRNEDKLFDWEWAKIFKVSIGSIQHVRYKISLAKNLSCLMGLNFDNAPEWAFVFSEQTLRQKITDRKELKDFRNFLQEQIKGD